MCLVCGNSLSHFVLLIDGVVRSFHGFQKEYTTTDSKQCCYKMIAKLQQQEKEYLHDILASHARKQKSRDSKGLMVQRVVMVGCVTPSTDFLHPIFQILIGPLVRGAKAPIRFDGALCEVQPVAIMSNFVCEDL